MNAFRNRTSWVWIMVIGFATVGAAQAADRWVQISGADAGSVAVEHAQPAKLQVEDRAVDGVSVRATLDGVRIIEQQTAAGRFSSIDWPEAQMAGAIGAPALPVMRRLVVVPDGVDPQLVITAGAGVAVDLAAQGLPVMPRQAPVPKLPGAKEAAPFDYDALAYAVDADLPSERAVLEELGVVRGQRLFLLELRPAAYNAATNALTVYPDLAAEVVFDGAEAPASRLNPLPGLSSVVANPRMINASARAGGNYLIVVAAAHQAGIAGFAAAKQAQGFNVSTYVVPAGTSNTTIKTYIQNQYNGPTPPDYVLLVGDTDTIPHFTGGGEGTPATDISYVCMDGSTDWYPDIAIGRFSARTAAQLTAIVSKTLYYENGPLADPDYLKRAVFMASTDNYTISEGTHNWVIDNHLTPNGYTSQKLYTVTYNATTADVTNAFNAGRFYGIYSGHGGTYSWADGPAFSQADVNALQNGNLYPFVCSFACITGTYTVDECFTETWSRAANKGAVAIYGSSVNSYWTEDDVLEKRLFDAIFDESDATPAEVGPVWNETRMRFLAEMGSDATTRRYFEMYNLLGDPSMRFPGSCTDAGAVLLDRAKYACGAQVSVTLNDCGLNTSDSVIDSIVLPIDSTSEAGVEHVTLIETDAASAEFTGSIMLTDNDYAGALLAGEGDTITVTYIDADTGQGQGATVTATADVDCTPPLISNVRTTNVEARTATVLFDGDEPVRGVVHYGLACAALNQSATGSGHALTAAVDLAGLNDNTTYFYAVDAEDEAGNAASDDNGGACYSFTTPEVPDYFTELFDGNDNDLDNLSLIFTPNGSNDFYASCTEAITALPTDPAGGTAVTLGDDDSAQVTLTGGAQVSLYGVSYSSFYIISNGYLTFGQVDDYYNESFAYHFDTMPKISALMDDLKPGTGTTVNWKQLADRVVVTWLNIPEYNTSNSNTFQVVMYFDGTIEINYLNIDAADGLAGLSDGGGTDPDFLESDLSAMGPCGPQPPSASNGSVSLSANTSALITLQAFDDGLPDPPAALDYLVTALPNHGELLDPNGGLIGAAPYTLLAGGKVVEYIPDLNYYGADQLSFKVDDGGTAPDGGESNEATVSVQVIARPPIAQNVSVDMDINGAETIQLIASDPDGDPLAFIITALPAHGSLADPWGGDIVATPYTLVSNGQAVVYKPDWDYVGADTFGYQVADGIFQTSTKSVNVLVIAAAPQIVTATLPDAQLGNAYGPVQLAVTGGQPEVAWSLVSEIEYTEVDLGASLFAPVGVAQGWNGDDQFWAYTLPFTFPFYGQDYTSVRVWSNGFLNFGAHEGSSYANSTQLLIDNIRIAPLWDDLKTTGAGEDIFIDTSVAGQVTIRWQGSGYGTSGTPRNFSVTLMETGSIRFDYGDVNTPITATVGISGGTGSDYTLSMYDWATGLTNVNSVLFKLPDELPPGLTLSSAGVISGTPTEAGVFLPTVRVTDSLNRTDQVALSVNVTGFAAGDCDSDGDGDVDLVDYAGFQRCFTGEAVPADAACGMFHADADGDIDLVDFAMFRGALGE